MIGKEEAKKIHRKYFGKSNDKVLKVNETNTGVTITSKGEETIIMKSRIFKDTIRKINFSNGRGFVPLKSEMYGEYYVYYLKLEGNKISRKRIAKNINLYRDLKLLLLELQDDFFIEYLRDEDFIISDNGELLFSNLNPLVPLAYQRNPECQCGGDLIIDIESYLKSEEKVFISQYKCVDCSKQYLITELKEYQSQKQKQRSVDDE